MDQAQEPSAKRQKLSPEASNSSTPQPVTGTITPQAQETNQSNLTDDAQLEREKQSGILHFVSPDTKGFSGILKQRFTDFLVNEIDPAGNVIHLTSTKVQNDEEPAKDEAKEEPAEVSAEVPAEVAEESTPLQTEAEGPFEISPEDRSLLESFFDAESLAAIEALHRKILRYPTGKHTPITTNAITDKEKRVQMHQAVRRIFNSKFETKAEAGSVISFSAVKPPRPGKKQKGNNNLNKKNVAQGKQLKGKLGWDELGGQYLHFTLYKENRDTMELMSFIASRSHSSSKAFTFAGTKDKRGATVQRVSAFRIRAEQLPRVNKMLIGGNCVGNYKYEKFPLALGDLSGNQFIITLRDCRFQDAEGLELPERVKAADAIVGDAFTKLQNRGFLNYYGLQRFGTSSAGTDEVGKRILSGDFESAVKLILSYSPAALDAALNKTEGLISRDDKTRAQGIHIFETKRDSRSAVALIRPRFAAERSIISHLGSTKGQDYLGALLQITRNLRLMYVHAYQSLVWNMAASERWAKYGDRVIAGDLVLVETKETAAAEEEEQEVDEDGEVIIRATGHDSAVRSEDLYQRARPLTAEEAQSGKYTIFDVVLPTPGFDIIYPANEIGEFYKTFMGSERGGGLDPYKMRRPQKDFSLSGSYRALMGRIGDDVSYEVRTYRGTEQLVKTDLERLEEVEGPIRRDAPNYAGNNGQLKISKASAAMKEEREKEKESGEKRSAAEAFAETVDESEIKTETKEEPESEEERIAVIVKFQLGTSQYATMALRELMKLGIRTFQAEYSTGR